MPPCATCSKAEPAFPLGTHVECALAIHPGQWHNNTSTLPLHPVTMKGCWGQYIGSASLQQLGKEAQLSQYPASGSPVCSSNQQLDMAQSSTAAAGSAHPCTSPRCLPSVAGLETQVCNQLALAEPLLPPQRKSHMIMDPHPPNQARPCPSGKNTCVQPRSRTAPTPGS